MPVTWNELGFNKNPFFLESITKSNEMKFFGDRDSETKEILAKIKQSSLPFVLEGDAGSGKTTLLAKVANELIGDDGAKLKDNKCLLVIVNSEKIIGDDLTKFAYSSLIYFILTDNRCEDIRRRINTGNITGIPPELVNVDKQASDLRKRFEMPVMGFEQLVVFVTYGGKVIFALDDLDKIYESEKKEELVKRWRHSVQEIPGISTIYVDNYGTDGFLKGVPGFFAHAPLEMHPIKKDDLRSILDLRIKYLSEDKFKNIDTFLSDDVWGLIHKVNRGERLRWTLQTLSRVFEEYMNSLTSVNDLKMPISYSVLKGYIEKNSEKALTVPSNLIPITNRLVEIFQKSIDKLTTEKLTDDDWKLFGVWRNHDKLIGAEVSVDSVIEKLPDAPQTVGTYLGELEKKRLLASRTIQRRKYYLPADDLMLFLKVMTR